MLTQNSKEINWFSFRVVTYTETNWANVHLPTRSSQVRKSKVQSLQVNKQRDSGNRLTAQATPTESLKQVRGALVNIMRVPTMSRASHNVLHFDLRVMTEKFTTGRTTTGNIRTGRALLRSLIDSDQQNVTRGIKMAQKQNRCARIRSSKGSRIERSEKHKY